VDVDLNAVITDVFSLLEHQSSRQHQGAPRAGAGDASVQGIEHQLQQVFLNLFPTRATRCRAAAGCRDHALESDRVVAEIADTGSGIPPSRSPIYDRSSPPKPSARHGLGLSITYGIVRSTTEPSCATARSGRARASRGAAAGAGRGAVGTVGTAN